MSRVAGEQTSVVQLHQAAATLMVSSGSRISADSFSLVCVSAYWLWENSAGVTERCCQPSLSLDVAFSSGLRQLIGANLVRARRSAPC